MPKTANKFLGCNTDRFRLRRTPLGSGSGAQSVARIVRCRTGYHDPTRTPTNVRSITSRQRNRKWIGSGHSHGHADHGDRGNSSNSGTRFSLHFGSLAGRWGMAIFTIPRNIQSYDFSIRVSNYEALRFRKYWKNRAITFNGYWRIVKRLSSDRILWPARLILLIWF